MTHELQLGHAQDGPRNTFARSQLTCQLRIGRRVVQVELDIDVVTLAQSQLFGLLLARE